VLPRTNLPNSSRRSSPNPRPFNRLQPLEISWLSFRDSRPLFSRAYSLLLAPKVGWEACQKPGVGIPLQTPPFGISSLQTLFSGAVCKRVTSSPNSPRPRLPQATGHQSRLRSPEALTPLSTAFTPNCSLTPLSTAFTQTHRGCGGHNVTAHYLPPALTPLFTAFLPRAKPRGTPNCSLTPLSTAFTQTPGGVGVTTPLSTTHYPPPTAPKIQSTTLTIKPSVRRWKPVNWPKRGDVVML